MQRERRQGVQRARRKVVRVHQACLEAAAAAGVDRSQGVGNRPDTMPAARDVADRFGQLPIRLL